MNFEVKVLGIRCLNFKDDKGQQISGHQIFVSGKTDSNGWLDGVEILKVWVPDHDVNAGKIQNLTFGSTLVIYFNRYGKPVIEW